MLLGMEYIPYINNEDSGTCFPSDFIEKRGVVYVTVAVSWKSFFGQLKRTFNHELRNCGGSYSR